jgi:hypothetical protein
MLGICAHRLLPTARIILPIHKTLQAAKAMPASKVPARLAPTNALPPLARKLFRVIGLYMSLIPFPPGLPTKPEPSGTPDGLYPDNFAFHTSLLADKGHSTARKSPVVVRNVEEVLTVDARSQAVVPDLQG